MTSENRPFLLGLTGSIGMGKSTTAAMFAEKGIPFWDADAAVARLYAPGGAGCAALAGLVPGAVGPDGIDREILRQEISADPELLSKIETVIHPLVSLDMRHFIENTEAPILLFDIPLLFETGADRWLDAVAVVSTDAATQRQRVLKRDGMTAESYEAIVARQMPDAEKRARADYVIPTDNLDIAAKAVDDVLRDIRQKTSHA